MRYQLLKLQRGHSTRAERVLAEILKSLQIPFRTKVILNGIEIDFIVDNYAIEINGHEQSPERNKRIIESGLVPKHFHNSEVLNNQNLFKQIICHLLDFKPTV